MWTIWAGLILMGAVLVLCDTGPSDYALLDGCRSTVCLRPGARGALVNALQNALAGVTFSVGGQPSGIFDAATESALLALQRNYSSWVDGSELGAVGSQTMRLFDALLGLVACPTPALQRLRQAEVTPDITANALRLLHLYWNHPVGSEFPFRSQGKTYFGRVELHFHPWNGTMTPHGYHHGISVFSLNATAAPPLSGSAFLNSTSSLSVAQRETLILRELARGNTPSCFDTPTRVSLYGGKLVLSVSHDYIALGSDHDFVRMPLAAFTAQKLADMLDCSLPTTKMVDLIWREAALKLVPRPLPPSSAMTSNAYFAKENALIQAQIPSTAGCALRAVFVSSFYSRNVPIHFPPIPSSCRLCPDRRRQEGRCQHEPVRDASNEHRHLWLALPQWNKHTAFVCWARCLVGRLQPR